MSIYYDPAIYKSTDVRTLFALTSLVVITIILMPFILKSLGLHPNYEGRSFKLEGKKALIISTSHGVLNYPGEVSGKPSGLASSELTAPYYEFIDANIKVDIASIKGGKIPVDPTTTSYFIKSSSDKRFYKDTKAIDKLNNSMNVEEVNFKEYDIVFLSGGWGAAYDLGFSDVLASGISEAYDAGSIIGAICHGPLGLINAKDKNGNILIANRKMTGVTDKQVKELGIQMTPQHPEEELKKAGAIFEAKTGFRDLFANHVVVDNEKRFVTGQNQNSGHETAQMIMKIIEDKS